MNEGSIHILIVEDNPDDLELALHALRRVKLAENVAVARDGEEALDFLFGRGAHSGRDTTRQPRIVLLDLKLPRVDGHEVLRAIRGDERTRLLPVIVMTSSDMDRDVMESYSLGVNSYVVKPINFEKFEESVARLGVYWLTINRPPAGGV